MVSKCFRKALRLFAKKGLMMKLTMHSNRFFFFFFDQLLLIVFSITLYQAVSRFDSYRFEDLKRDIKLVCKGNVNTCELECINGNKSDKKERKINRQLVQSLQ